MDEEAFPHDPNSYFAFCFGEKNLLQLSAKCEQYLISDFGHNMTGTFLRERFVIPLFAFKKR
jgi:hypothetical protein